MKKIISAFLALTMLLSVTAGVQLSAFAMDDTIHYMDQMGTETITVTTGGQKHEIRFTPQETGDYMFRSENSDFDTRATLMLDDKKLTENDDFFGVDFGVFYHLEKNKMYVLHCRFYNSSKTGKFDVVVQKNPVKSISYTLARPRRILQNHYGVTIKDDEGKDFYFYGYEGNGDNYNAEARRVFFNEGDRLTLTMTDGSKHVYTAFIEWDEQEEPFFYFADSNGDELYRMPDYYDTLDDQYDGTHWGLGKHTLTYKYFGRTCTATAEVATEGFLHQGKKTYYIRNGNPLKGWQTIDGKRYLFANADGLMLHDRWYTTGDKKKFYLGSDGAAYTYYKAIGGKYYYFNGVGVMQKGWVAFGANKRYFGSDGAMLKYFQTIAGKSYYFNGAGLMQKGWISFGTDKRYFGTDGVMKTGFQTINNKRYLFANANGLMLKNRWYTTGDKKKFYLGSDGAAYTYLKTIGGKQYYFSGYGVMYTGWLKISGKWYFFDPNGGAMLKNTNRKIGTKTYRFNASGVCTNK